MNLQPASWRTNQSLDPQLALIAEAVISRLQTGEGVTVEELAAAHPEFADQLRELLPTMQALIHLGDQPGLAVDPEFNGSGPPVPKQEQLGDFRIVRELGHGGMGMVFEAEQLSMGRRVALKVLPFAALANEKSLQRFRNEVRAAAALDHPHIVSVYSIGEDRGVHFYAMQFVRGQTVADLIQQLRSNRLPVSIDPLGDTAAAENSATEVKESPTSSQPNVQARTTTAVESRRTAEHHRTAARLGIEAAEALQHAHDQGVLHRDIKPSNLLLDGEGKLFITDFGLARIVADASITMTGDMIGTLRYMAPEQALARRVVIDHRADVYSLGATLYEVLTLEPAFTETDRSALLKQIGCEEPKSLQKYDHRIPIDLETIVRKAMAKCPDERYQTAQQLADDLRAFLGNRPIQARPPTITNRVIKWSRRHVAVIWTVTIGLLVATASLIASTVFIARERADAIAARDDALEYFELARGAVDGMMTRVADEQLLDTPQAEHLRERLYEDALAYYEKLLNREADSPELQLEAALAQERVSRILMDLDRRRESLAAQAQAIERLTVLVRKFPQVPVYQYHLARALTTQGLHIAQVDFIGGDDPPYQGRVADGSSTISYLDRAIEILDDLVATHPQTAKYQSELARALFRRFGQHNRDRTFAEAIEQLQRARSILRPLVDRPDAGEADLVNMAATHGALSTLRLQVGDHHAAQEASARAIEFARRLVEAYPGNPENRSVLATVLSNTTNDQSSESLAVKQQRREEVVQLMAGLADDFPARPEFRARLAMAEMHFGNLLCQARDHDAAETRYRQAIELLAGLCREFPTHEDYYNRQTRVYGNLLGMYKSIGDDVSFLAVLDEMKRFGLNAAGQQDESWEMYTAFAEFSSIAPLLRQNHDDEAIDTVREAWERAQRVFDAMSTPEQAKYYAGFLHDLLSACTALLEAGHNDTALEYARKLVELHRRRIDAEVPPTDASRTELAELLVSWPQAELRDLDEAGRLDPTRFGAPQRIGDYYAELGRYLEAAGQYSTAVDRSPDDAEIVARAALLKLASGDHAGHETLSQRMFEKYVLTADPVTACRTCWACAMSSKPVGDAEKLIQLAERALREEKTLHLAAQVRGLVAYRAGDWNAALKWSAKSREIDPGTSKTVSKSINQLIEAMALQRLGRADEARASYEDAVSLSPPSKPGSAWLEWICYRQLHGEAEELLVVKP